MTVLQLTKAMTCFVKLRVCCAYSRLSKRNTRRSVDQFAEPLTQGVFVPVLVSCRLGKGSSLLHVMSVLFFHRSVIDFSRFWIDFTFGPAARKLNLQGSTSNFVARHDVEVTTRRNALYAITGMHCKVIFVLIYFPSALCSSCVFQCRLSDSSGKSLCIFTL